MIISLFADKHYFNIVWKEFQILTLLLKRGITRKNKDSIVYALIIFSNNLISLNQKLNL